MDRRTFLKTVLVGAGLTGFVGFPMAEVARRLGVGTSAIAMAIRRRNPEGQKL